jgi:hypothetical protein
MSRTDPSEARGQILNGPPTDRCTTPGCGDLSTVHQTKDDGERGACAAAFCRCRRYTPTPGGAQ